jgi:hypothetical protein
MAMRVECQVLEDFERRKRITFKHTILGRIRSTLAMAATRYVLTIHSPEGKLTDGPTFEVMYILFSAGVLGYSMITRLVVM